MSKTNFKCMFLVDDKLYKKAILKEETSNIPNSKTIIPNSIYLNPVTNSQQQLSSGSESMNRILEKDPSQSTDTYEVSRPATGAIPGGETLSNEQRMTIPEATASEDFVTPIRIIENGVNMETDQSVAKDDDCECYEQAPVASAKRGRKRQKSGELRDDFDSPARKKEYKKRQVKKSKVPIKISTVRKPSGRKTISLGEKVDADLSDESDWEELRERYRRLRGDYDSPPRKKEYKKSTATKRYVSELPVVRKKDPVLAGQNNRKKSKDDVSAVKEIKMIGARKRKLDNDLSSMKIPRREFVCKLCQSYYKTKASLQRHNLNIHSDQRGSKRTKSGDEDRYIKRQKNNNNIAVSYLNYF